MPFMSRIVQVVTPESHLRSSRAARMDLDAFRPIVDSCPDRITPVLGDLKELYSYVGLPVQSSLSRSAVGEELDRKIFRCFTSGHALVRRRCRELREELIQCRV